MVRVMTHPHERHIWLKTVSHLSDLVYVDLVCDDLMPERGHKWFDDRKALRPLVRDQDAEIPGPVGHS
jgi:hypothetical protein